MNRSTVALSLLILGAATLTGCAAKLLASSQDNILISASDINDALALAKVECRKYKGYAKFIDKPDSGHYRYKCMQ
jgi:methylase of polypeptide subunit release factors